MRRTDEAFKAEVFRRSREYKARQARKRKQLLTLCSCLAVAVGLFLLNPPTAEKQAMDLNAAASHITAESPMEMAPAPMAPQAPGAAAPELPDISGSGCYEEEENVGSAPPAMPSDRPLSFYAGIGDAVTKVDITHYRAGTQRQWTAEGESLTPLREWANGLLYEPAEFPEGQTPGDREGGEVYEFTLTGGDYPNFTYVVCGSGEHYLLAEGHWYAVANPSLPPDTAPICGYPTEADLNAPTE